MKQGKFIVSLDFELFWGFGGFDRQFLNGYKGNVTNALKALDEILRICGKYGVKVTVAYVGAMNLSSRKEFLEKYSSPSFTNKTLSSHSLLSNYDDIIEDSLLFCQDKIKELKKNTLVELASHTFSHYYCLEEGQTSAEFSRDLDYGYKLNGKMSSIIFPRNQVSESYLRNCEQYGFTHYRGFIPDWLWKPEASSSRYSFKGLLRLIDSYLPLTGYRTYKHPIHGSGIVNVPSSIFYRPYNKKLSFLEPLKVHRVTSAMKVAAKRGECFHLWWHPHNFGANMNESLTQLITICETYQKLNSQYGYTSVFMKEL